MRTLAGLKQSSDDTRSQIRDFALPLADSVMQLENDLVWSISALWKTQEAWEALKEIYVTADASELENMKWCVRWSGLCRPTFELTHSACAAMMLTEMHGIKQSDVKLPFGSLLIILPYPRPLLRVVPGSVAQDVRWITVTRIYEPGEDHRRQMFKRLVDLRGVTYDDEYINIHNENIVRFLKSARSVPHTEYLFIQGFTAEGGALSIKLSNKDDLEKLASNTESKANRLPMVSMVRIAVNAMLYVTMQATSRGQRPPSSDSQSRKSSASPSMHTVIGREIKLSTGLIDTARDMSRDVPVSQWRLKSRFCVRGHWRMQACGAKLQDRKRMWIAPHWKGPETAEQLERLYKSEEFVVPT